MRQKAGTEKASAEQVVKDIRRATRKQYGAEEKIRIVLEGLRGEESIAALCRREGLAESLYYSWSKEFLEAGKKRLAGDTARAATRDEVKILRKETRDLKEVVAKKHDRGCGRRRMRYPASEKLEIIRLVEQSHLPARCTLEKLGIPRATFHRWYDRFLSGGVHALEDRPPRPKRVWNRIPEEVRERIIELALDRPELSPRELAKTFIDAESYFVSEASVYRLLKAHDLITSPAFIAHQGSRRVQGQDDGSEPAVADRLYLLEGDRLGLVYLSTILDDFSRYIIAWKLCTTMKVEDVTDTLSLALAASGCDTARVTQRPRLLSDNGPCYVAGDLADWLADQSMEHTRGSPCHPQTQGKIERWHQTLKNRILLENYFLPGNLEAQIAAFVEHYNHRRYHESLDNLTPADVYFGRGQTILLQRERIKRKTIEQRRLQHRRAAA